MPSLTQSENSGRNGSFCFILFELHPTQFARHFFQHHGEQLLNAPFFGIEEQLQDRQRHRKHPEPRLDSRQNPHEGQNRRHDEPKGSMPPKVPMTPASTAQDPFSFGQRFGHRREPQPRPVATGDFQIVIVKATIQFDFPMVRSQPRDEAV